MSVPLISFSFDDAPQSAFDIGGEILNAHNVRATYYVSLGLLSSQSAIGLIASRDTLVRAVESGHELGCHTFHHHDAWNTGRAEYIASIDENQCALEDVLPGYAFRSFAYPKNGATLWVKAPLERRFECCRGGGQSINSGSTDLNLLKACFLDRRARVDVDFVRALIQRNAESGGWLIFAAHDISDAQRDFSCGVGFFETVVSLAADSGAQILPVAAACARIRDVHTSRAMAVERDSVPSAPA